MAQSPERLGYLCVFGLTYTRVPSHLAQISGKCLSHVSLPGCRRHTVCRIDTYRMTVSPRPKSSVSWEVRAAR